MASPVRRDGKWPRFWRPLNAVTRSRWNASSSQGQGWATQTLYASALRARRYRSASLTPSSLIATSTGRQSCIAPSVSLGSC